MLSLGSHLNSLVQTLQDITYFLVLKEGDYISKETYLIVQMFFIWSFPPYPWIFQSCVYYSEFSGHEWEEARSVRGQTSELGGLNVAVRILLLNSSCWIGTFRTECNQCCFETSILITLMGKDTIKFSFDGNLIGIFINSFC